MAQLQADTGLDEPSATTNYESMKSQKGEEDREPSRQLSVTMVNAHNPRKRGVSSVDSVAIGQLVKITTDQLPCASGWWLSLESPKKPLASMAFKPSPVFPLAWLASAIVSGCSRRAPLCQLLVEPDLVSYSPVHYPVQCVRCPVRDPSMPLSSIRNLTVIAGSIQGSIGNPAPQASRAILSNHLHVVYCFPVVGMQVLCACRCTRN